MLLVEVSVVILTFVFKNIMLVVIIFSLLKMILKISINFPIKWYLWSMKYISNNIQVTFRKKSKLIVTMVGFHSFYFLAFFCPSIRFKGKVTSTTFSAGPTTLHWMFVSRF